MPGPGGMPGGRREQVDEAEEDGREAGPAPSLRDAVEEEPVQDTEGAEEQRGEEQYERVIPGERSEPEQPDGPADRDE